MDGGPWAAFTSGGSAVIEKRTRHHMRVRLNGLGVSCVLQKLGEPGGEVHRAAFTREVTDERDARSVLTMLAQISWERERNYTPVMPVLVPDTINT